MYIIHAPSVGVNCTWWVIFSATVTEILQGIRKAAQCLTGFQTGKDRAWKGGKLEELLEIGVSHEEDDKTMGFWSFPEIFRHSWHFWHIDISPDTFCDTYPDMFSDIILTFCLNFFDSLTCILLHGAWHLFWHLRWHGQQWHDDSMTTWWLGGLRKEGEVPDIPGTSGNPVSLETLDIGGEKSVWVSVDLGIISKRHAQNGNFQNRVK